MAQHIGFNTIIQNSNWRMNKISRHTVTRELKKISIEIDEILLESPRDVKVVGETTEVWTVQPGEVFASFTLFFISKYLELKNVVLGCSVLPGRQTGKVLSDNFMIVMRKIKLYFKTVFTTRDGATNAKYKLESLLRKRIF